ncbi:response regulator [Flavipsychrobacter stenotrophus]|uniref:Response regulator n=1 Tax=Flavipsychrobacter stenotrophus TaxID=2077091 RepID=A0A2S7T1R1_9BACT|nr:response regulator [Flavipsychrobacter stenotrophus]PQJ12801.1 response regulator [Flavipsychrobacter stenotrophus]
MTKQPLHLLLADDDADDCIFFDEALKELPIDSSLETVGDGEQLMRLLISRPRALPDMLFLDLNMPRKNGFECLAEIKTNQQLKCLPVIIYSTSLDRDVVNLLYEKGALHYIRKPGDFSKLKEIIFLALTSASINNGDTISKDNFIIQVQ